MNQNPPDNANTPRSVDQQQACSPVEGLTKWARWGPHGGPPEVYEYAEQPDYAKKAGTLVVWAKLPGWMKIQIKPWYYHCQANAKV
jgi:hypothetical protein